MATPSGAPRLQAAREAAPSRPRLGGLSHRRQLVALLVAGLGLPLLTAALIRARGSLALDSVLLIYLLAVVVIAVAGGMGPALVAAVASFLLANWYLTPPYHTFEVEGRDRFIQLLVFVVVAAMVSVTVDVGARQAARGERHRMEAALLSRLASSDIGATTPEGVLDQIGELFELSRVELIKPGTAGAPVLASVGTGTDVPSLTVSTDGGLVVRGYGPHRFAEDSRLLRALAETAARAWSERRLAEEAARAEQLAETDRLRAALLAAVGHDLRTPLAGIKAAVSTLRQDDVEWTPAERRELLADIETATDRLTDIITNLLAMSRLHAGAVSVQLETVALDEVVGRALLEGHAPQVQLAIPEDLPPLLTDPGLLQRVLANLLDNASRYAPAGQPVTLRARLTDDATITLQVEDHGPGVPERDWLRMFVPFQRLDDREARSGAGLGLAIASGFSQAVGASLTPHQTPGGGLTMRIELPVAP